MGVSLCKKEKDCLLSGSPLAGFGPPCFLLVGVLAPGRLRLARCCWLSFLVAVWSLLCPLLLLSLLFPSSVLCPLSPVRCLLLPLCLVLGGLLPLVWLLLCGLVRTLCPLCARTVVLVSVVRRTLPVLSVVLCLRMPCSPGCRLVLGRLSGSVLRLATRLTSGLLVLKGFDMRVLLFVLFAVLAVVLLGFALVGYWPLGFASALCSLCAFTVATVDEFH